MANNSNNQPYVPTGFSRGRRVSDTNIYKFAETRNCSKIPKNIKDKLPKETMNVLCEGRYKNDITLNEKRLIALKSGKKENIKSFFNAYLSKSYRNRGGSKKKRAIKRYTKTRSARK